MIDGRRGQIVGIALLLGPLACSAQSSGPCNPGCMGNGASYEGGNPGASSPPYDSTSGRVHLERPGAPSIEAGELGASRLEVSTTSAHLAVFTRDLGPDELANNAEAGAADAAVSPPHLIAWLRWAPTPFGLVGDAGQTPVDVDAFSCLDADRLVSGESWALPDASTRTFLCLDADGRTSPALQQTAKGAVRPGMTAGYHLVATGAGVHIDVDVERRPGGYAPPSGGHCVYS